MNKLTCLIIVVVFYLSGNKVLAQQSSEGALLFSKKQLVVSPYEGCAVADINQDGHMDIVSSPHIFYGPDFIPRAFRSNHLSPDHIRANSDLVYDVDEDGLPDIIIGAWGAEGPVWYKNPGNSAADSGKPWEMHKAWEIDTLTKTSGNNEMYALHDYDCDGIPEIHISCWVKEEPQKVYRFTKSGTGQPALESIILGEEGGGHGFAWGDVNGDGREDLLSEIGWYERPEGDPFARTWTLHPETDLSKLHPSCPFITKDLNEDGRLDIVFGKAHDYGLFWWEQLEPLKNGTTRWKEHLIDDTWSQIHVLYMADLDNDGEEEMVTGKCIWAHNGRDPGYDDPPMVFYYDWNKNTQSFERHNITDSEDGIAMGRQISIADLNDDGWLDIVSPSETGLWILINEGYK